MTDDLTRPLTVEDMYGDWPVEFEEALEIAERPIAARPRTSMYDTFGDLGVGEGDHVLDIGGRDSAQALDLAERFGCRVLSVDPVQANLDFGTAGIAEHSHGHLVENRLGTINEIPADDDTFDAIFARDMMGHVEDLVGALVECRRVLKPGGAMVIHDVFATPMLEPKEAAQLCHDLAQVPERLDAELFVRIVDDTGFTIEVIDPVASEWLEVTLGADDAEKRLLMAARLNRDRDRLVEEMGAIPYRVVRGNNLWTIYRMIGKLEDRVYVIRSATAP